MKEKVVLFFKKNCPKCEIGKRICKALEEKGYKVEYFDVETVEGLTEFTLEGFMFPPAIMFGNRKFNSMLEAEKELKNV